MRKFPYTGVLYRPNVDKYAYLSEQLDSRLQAN